MLTIIGLIGCLYLLVKSCEFAGSSAYRTEEGWLKPAAWCGAALSICGALVFALWLLIQNNALASTVAEVGGSPSSATMNVDANLPCIDAAGNDIDCSKVN